MLSDEDARRLLESLSTYDDPERSVIHHGHGDNCGHCHHLHLYSVVAREILARGEPITEASIREWDMETTKRWEASKYVRTWREAVERGEDPRAVFARLGWEP